MAHQPDAAWAFEQPLAQASGTNMLPIQFWGPRLRGRVLPVGADWLTLRTDGVGIVDIRCTLEAEDGALIYVTVNGIIDLGPDGHQMLLSGQTPPDGAPDSSGVAVLHGASRLPAWLNRVSGLPSDKRSAGARGKIEYDVYAVR